MLTKNDMKKLREEFVTKDYLNIVVKDIIEYIGEVRKELKEDILVFKDQILSEIIKIRDDFAVLTGYRDMIEDHEERIVKLEKRKIH